MVQTKSYLQAKIDASQLTWSPDIRIAFSVELNARSILKATSHLSFGGRPYAISPQLIAVNEAHYPDARRLRKIHGFEKVEFDNMNNAQPYLAGTRLIKKQEYVVGGGL